MDHCAACMSEKGEQKFATTRCIKCGAGICARHIFECRKCNKPMCMSCWRELGKDLCGSCKKQWAGVAQPPLSKKTKSVFLTRRFSVFIPNKFEHTLSSGAIVMNLFWKNVPRWQTALVYSIILPENAQTSEPAPERSGGYGKREVRGSRGSRIGHLFAPSGDRGPVMVMHAGDACCKQPTTSRKAA